MERDRESSMSLKDLKAKTQGAVDFAADRKPVVSTEPKRPVTGPGAQAFAHDTIVEYKRKAEDAEVRAAGAQAKLTDAESKLAKFDGAIPVRALNPKAIRRSRWANRIEEEFATKEFQELKDEIANAGGNVQPIKVRVVDGQPPSPTKGFNEPKGLVDGQPVGFEIVFGHRRHQACLELGLLVSAVVVDDMDDRALFEAMDRENRGRKNLSAWEQGRMYDEAIKKGLYPSIRRLEEALGVNHSDAVRAVQLSKLPKEVVSAFATPLDLQVRWSKPLADALQRDPDGVLARAKEAGKKRGSLDATEVFELLVGTAPKPAPKEIDILAAGKKLATVRTGPKGRAFVEFEAGVLPVEKHEALAKLLKEFLTK